MRDIVCWHGCSTYKLANHFSNVGVLQQACQNDVFDVLPIHVGMWWCNWLRHWATSWKVAGSIPDGVIGSFH